MKTRLIIARHGNTFRPEDTPTRVGARTDLDLVENKKGKLIGIFLKKKGWIPETIYSGPLKRHYQTAELISKELKLQKLIKKEDFLNEIDYGVDENKTELDVRKRLGNGDEQAGKKIIELWNRTGEVPNGWKINTEQLRHGWLNFSLKIAKDHPQQTTLVVSSNGVMRFSHVLDPGFSSTNLKVPTGGLCVFELEDVKWKCIHWGITPE